MNTSSGDQFSGSRGSRSPRSSEQHVDPAPGQRPRGRAPAHARAHDDDVGLQVLHGAILPRRVRAVPGPTAAGQTAVQVRHPTTPSMWLRGPMPTIGFHCSHEQIAPGRLLRDVQHAEQAGFTAAMSSDHLSPWSRAAGRVGLRVVLPRAPRSPRPSLPFGVVTAPGQRYHPAITAQAIATLASMFPGRFWAALGSGEASNERVTGDVWPRKDVRDARLLECVDVIRRLLAGETGRPRRPRHGQPRPPVDPPGCRAAPHRPGRHPRDRRPPRGLGRRPGHRQPAARHPAAGARRLPRRRWPRRRPASRCTSAGRRPTTRPSPSPTTSGAATCTAHRSAGTPRPSRPST